jgi:hypothetical protein
MVLALQAKSLFGFVTNAVSNHSCKLEVVFTKPDGEEPLEHVKLKAQGKHAAEELPLFQDNSGGRVCGQVRPAQLCTVHRCLPHGCTAQLLCFMVLPYGSM